MAHKQIAAKKIRRTLHNALSAWWVLLIMLLYMLFAWYYLGTGCLFSSVTGIPCPGCGITRAGLSLIRGNIVMSLHYHPLLIPGAVLFCVYISLWLTREHIPGYMERIILVFAVIVVFTFVIRMIFLFPYEPPLNFNNKAIIPRIIIKLMELLR